MLKFSISLDYLETLDDIYSPFVWQGKDCEKKMVFPTSFTSGEKLNRADNVCSVLLRKSLK